jgi:4-hydroxythreonine-4-phosphate dehydrogenase
MDSRPLTALTIGDPAGVGPEILLAALADRTPYEVMRPLVIGDGAAVAQVIAGRGLDLEVRTVSGPEDVRGDAGVVELLDLENAGEVRFGVVDPTYGRAAMDYIEVAAELARDGRVEAMVTGPINKEAIRAAGSPFPGHTEMLADLLGVAIDDVFTMFTVERMRIFFLTRHYSLAEAITRITTDGAYDALVKMNELMKMLGFATPRIGLAAVNPHAGDGGLMGDEDQRLLDPAVARAREAGVDVTGPVPADSVFWQCRTGRYDAVLSVYHDQGHVAAKTLDFFGTVSCTLGLPVIRTAAEHGTAFDIAGRWIADPGGQAAAMQVAAELAVASRAAGKAA